MKCVKCGRDYPNAYTQCMTCQIPLGPRGQAYLGQTGPAQHAPMSEYDRQLAQSRVDPGTIAKPRQVPGQAPPEERTLLVVVGASEGFMKPKWDIMVTEKRLVLLRQGAMARAKNSGRPLTVDLVVSMDPQNISFMYEQITMVSIAGGTKLTIQAGHLVTRLNIERSEAQELARVVGPALQGRFIAG